MRCLYEVLGVLPEADDATVRTAYRREALRNHPDKNPGEMAAEERFKEVQNAYEILSDKHERAWYDAHRDSILRSGERHQAGAGADLRTERPDDWIDVFAYHTSACYSGFSDGARGFYTVYSNLFERLAKQEESASEQRTTSRNGASATWLPLFGRSDASWEDVSAFYATWGSFATSRDFAWADVYNPASAPNRRVRRAMEQENEKSRRAARREYNEGVRGLVEFLRKRDKRVAAHQVEVAKARQEREEAEKAR
jgi:DnaJ homolog subfamily A member 5